MVRCTFTDPGYRVPIAERELDAAVYRIAPDGAVSLAVPVEYPNGLALSPDERTLYIANTRWCQYIHAVELDAGGTMVRRRVFADMSADGTNGVPDGMKVDAAGRVFCTGTGGVWVFAPDGSKIGIIAMPEVCANVAFGGPDLRTLFLTASTSVYTLRVKTPGMAHPWYKHACLVSRHCEERRRGNPHSSSARTPKPPRWRLLRRLRLLAMTRASVSAATICSRSKIPAPSRHPDIVMLELPAIL